MIQTDFNFEVPESTRERLGFATATDADLAVLSEQKRKILGLLRDKWVSTVWLIQATGATDAARRVRELRADGYEILKRGEGRNWEYSWTGKKSMNINKLIELVFNSLPGKVTNLETYSDCIRFDFSGCRFRVSQSLFVEEVKGSMLLYC